MTVEKILSRNILRWRRKNNLSQERLAEKIGVNTTTVNKWESGKNFPSIKKCEILADVFHIPVSFLFQD